MNDPDGSPRSRFGGRKAWLLAGLVAVTGLALLGYKLGFTPAVVARLPLGDQGSVTIYASPAFRYKPPGFLTCEIVRDGQTVLANQSFATTGPKRVPPGRFAVLTDESGETLAITLNEDVVFLHDFRTHQFWPDTRGQTDEPGYAFAGEALHRLSANYPGLRCRNLSIYGVRKKIDALNEMER